MIVSVVGWILLIAAAALMIQAWIADRKMQRFRVAGQPAGDYLLIPVRGRSACISLRGIDLLLRLGVRLRR
jgi:hypothetical protein